MVPAYMIAKTCRDNLHALATAYARATGASLKQISKKFYGNRDFLGDFRRGEGTISIDKFDRVVEAFKAEWPANTDWPLMQAAVISRPALRKLSPRDESSTKSDHGRRRNRTSSNPP